MRISLSFISGFASFRLNLTNLTDSPTTSRPSLSTTPPDHPPTQPLLNYLLTYLTSFYTSIHNMPNRGGGRGSSRGSGRGRGGSRGGRGGRGGPAGFQPMAYTSSDQSSNGLRFLHSFDCPQLTNFLFLKTTTARMASSHWHRKPATPSVVPADSTRSFARCPSVLSQPGIWIRTNS